MNRSTILLTLGAALAAGVLLAQNPGVQRTVVQKGDVSVPGREAVVARIDVAPDARTGFHTHPGDEIDYVTDGELEITFQGQAPHKVKAGESIVIPGGTKHDAHNAGTIPVKAIGVYVVEKGQPLATMVP